MSARQPAVLHGAGMALHCEILDYCRAGLYLAFAQPLLPEAVRALAPGSTVELVFEGPEAVQPQSPSSGRSKSQPPSQQQPLRLLGRIVRSLPGGLGIQLAELPDAALAALRASGARAAHAAPAIGDAATAGLGPQARRALRQQCSQLFKGFIQAVLKTFFAQAPSRLTQAGSEAMGTALRARFDETARELQQPQRRNVVSTRLVESIGAAVRQLGRERVQEFAEGASAELALVDDDQFEDWLNLSTVTHRLEADLSLPLADLHQRYGALQGTVVDRASNPFAPELICRSFQDAILALDPPIAIRAVLYKTFGEVLTQHCPVFYERLNAVLAPLAEQPAPARSRDAASDGTAKAPPPRDDPNYTAPSRDALAATARTSPSAAQPAAVDELSELGALVATLQERQREFDTSVAGDGAASAGHRRAVDEDLADLLRRLRQHGRGPVESKLPAIQAGVCAAALPAPPPAPASSAQDLLLRLAGLLRPTVGLLPGEDRQAASLAADVLGRALTDSGSGAEIQMLLARLAGPLATLAEREGDCLAEPDHPARRVVDLLEQYAIATDEHGRFIEDRLRRFLMQLVERIAGQTDPEPGLFEQASSNLARLLQPLREARRLRVARLQEAWEGRERIRRTRRRIDAALATQLGGGPVPEIVLRLLESGWRQHLMLLEIRDSVDDEDARHEALTVLDRLREWLGPDYVPTPTFRDEARTLARRIEAALAAVNPDTERRHAFMELLELSFANVAEGGAPHPSVAYPSLPAGDSVAAGMHNSTPGSGSDRSPDSDSGSNSSLDHEALRVGEWWLVARGGQAQPMQLIWQSRPAGHCLLVNRAATDKLELSIDEFAQRRRAALIRPWPDQELPLLERMEYSLLDESRQALRQRAMHDPVSGLLNRKGFVSRVDQVCRQPTAYGAALIGVIEFDQLRIIFQSCGIEAAEGLIREVARTAQDCLGSAALLAGFRDDTIGFLLPDAEARPTAALMDQLLQELGDYRFHHGDQSFSLGINVGLAPFEPGSGDPEQAIAQADAACVASKAQGRNRGQVYEPGCVQLRHQESLAGWAGRIDHLLEGGGLFLRAQRVAPIGKDPALVPYYEILLGIDGSSEQPAAPQGLVAAMERLKRSQDLDLWVMRQVLDWIAANRRVFDTIGGFSINVSALSMDRPEFIGYLCERLSRPDVPAHKLSFEITETAAIGSYGAAQEFIRQLRRHGCKFALDDFGSGYASYAHLKNLRTDSMKIDGAFVREMVDNPSDHAMVKSMHEVARSLGMRTVAEYVETPLILDRLREIGVDYAQGYAIHKPCRIDELAGR